MAHAKIQNVIFCEDVRDEVGNRKSLMGVMNGDVLVPVFPATLQVAVYFECLADESDGDTLEIELRILQNDIEIAKGNMRADISGGRSRQVNFVVPKGFITFEKSGRYSLRARVKGGSEEEILSKQILQG